MPFKKGRAKTGGRVKGVPVSAIRRDVADKLAEIGFDPIMRMIDIANQEGCPPAIASRICAEVAQYVHAKRRSLEISGRDGEAIQIKRVIGVSDEEM